MQFILSTIQLAVGSGAVAFWALGMCFWWLLDHADQHSRTQLKKRVVRAFTIMVVLGTVAYMLPSFSEVNA